MTKSKLKTIFSKADTETINDFYDTWIENAKKYGITTKHHEDMFLATVLAEVGKKLIGKRENLNYSCKRLSAVFKYYKTRRGEATKDGRCNGKQANKKAIANKAYGHKYGNSSKNDGWKFRGGGIIQLTFKNNFQSACNVIFSVSGKRIGVDELSEKISEMPYSLLTAMAYFYMKKGWKCKNMNCMTSLVNKNTKSRNKRNQYYKMISKIQE